MYTLYKRHIFFIIILDRGPQVYQLPQLFRVTLFKLSVLLLLLLLCTHPCTRPQGLHGEAFARLGNSFYFQRGWGTPALCSMCESLYQPVACNQCYSAGQTS